MSSSGGVDVDVVAQAVEQLRPVGLRVDRLHLDALDIFAPLRPVGLGVEVDALRPSQSPASRAQRPEVRQRVGIDVVGLGEDVVGEVGHARPLPKAAASIKNRR